MNHRNIPLTGLILCLSLIFTLISCDNSIERSGKEAGYSIYGVLRLKADTNYIRVKNLNVPLVLDSMQSLNATVHLKNLKTGRSQLLTDDSLIFFKGVATHNLMTTMPIRPLTTYKVIVKRNSGGHLTTAQVTTPIPTNVTIRPGIDSCGTTRILKYQNVTGGETIVSYISAKLLVGPQKRDPPKTAYSRRLITLYSGEPGVIFSHSMRIILPASVCFLLSSEKIKIYTAVYGPGHFDSPDSATNVNRFLKSKLASVYIDTLSFLALTDTTYNPIHHDQ